MEIGLTLHFSIEMWVFKGARHDIVQLSNLARKKTLPVANAADLAGYGNIILFGEQAQ